MVLRLLGCSHTLFPPAVIRTQQTHRARADCGRSVVHGDKGGRGDQVNVTGCVYCMCNHGNACLLIVGQTITWERGMKQHCRERDGSTHPRNTGAAGRRHVQARLWLGHRRTDRSAQKVSAACVLEVKGAYLLLRLLARLRQLVALNAVREPVTGKGTSLARQGEPIADGIDGKM